MAVLTVDLSPDHIPCNTSVTGYLPVPLTLSVYNGDTAPADVSGGLSVVFSVDPGGAGSGAALLLSGLSDPQGSGQQIPLANPIPDPGTWHVSQLSTVPFEFVLTPQVATQNFIPPGQTLTFTFSNVVADLKPGVAPVPVTVLPSVLPNGTAATIGPPPPRILKLPPPLETPALSAGPQVLTPPSNATTLTWLAPGAASCTLTWSPVSAVVTDASGQQQHSPWTTAPLQVTAQAPVTAALLDTTSFTLTSVGSDSSQANPQATLTVTLDTPRFSHVYVPPLVSAVSPPSGDPAGGQQVTITGTRLTQASAVTFTPVGGTTPKPATNVASVPGAEDTQVTATTPAGTGIAHVTVKTPIGTSPAIPADIYTYTSTAGLPVVTGVAPPYGEVAGGQLVTITGAGFADPATVTFTPAGGAGSASQNAAGVTVVSAAELTATTPPGGTGPADITVTTASGTSPVTPAGGYTYVSQGMPWVTGIALPGADPSAGDPAGGQQAVITGTGLSGATSVVFTPLDPAGTSGDATGIANVPGAEDTQVTAITPAGTGTVDVIVTAAGGTSPAVPADQFSYGIPAVLVPPYQPFQLTWSCYTGSDTHLSWQFTGDTSVIAESVTVTGEAGTVNSGDSVPVTGRAVATINGPATFQLEVLAGRPAPANVQVGIAPLEFTGLTPSGPVLTDTGEQTVTLNWYAANVVVYTLDLNGITLTNPPAYGDRTCTVSVPPVTVPMPQSTFTYTLTAYGYGSNNEWVSIPQSVHVTPLTVALLPLGMSGPQWVPNPTGTPPEVQMVSLTFAAQNANSITITGPAPGQSVTLLPDATASPPLYLPAPTLPGPLLYGVTVTANGYFAPGVTYSAWRTFSPLTVQLGPLTASPRPSPSSGSPVSLTWTAANETGFIFDDSSSGTLTGLPAGQRQLTVNPRGETTYTLTAQGYPSGPALPYRAVTVTIKPLKEHKEVLDKLSPTTAEKHLRPKEDNPTIPAAGLPADDESELPEPDPAGPAGSQPGQQPFIGQDERPDAAPPARA